MKGLTMKYFVLKPKGDTEYARASQEAMLAYANYIEDFDPELADELNHWVEKEHSCEINSTGMFGASVARVSGFRSKPTVNTDEDMVRVVLDMPKGAWRKLKSTINSPA